MKNEGDFLYGFVENMRRRMNMVAFSVLPTLIILRVLIILSPLFSGLLMGHLGFMGPHRHTWYHLFVHGFEKISFYITCHIPISFPRRKLLNSQGFKMEMPSCTHLSCILGLVKR